MLSLQENLITRLLSAIVRWKKLMMKVESLKGLLHLKMAQLIKVSGLMGREMDMVFSFGLMVRDTRAYGWEIKLTETES